MRPLISTDIHSAVKATTGHTLAPEEPNVYRSNYESKTCAPAERDAWQRLETPAKKDKKLDSCFTDYEKQLMLNG